MQAKGLVKFFVTALIFVCLFQLIFTFKAWQIGGHADDYAANKAEGLEVGDVRDSVIAANRAQYIDSITGEVVLDLYVAEFTYTDVLDKQLGLGLDLQGGMSVVLQVSLEDLIKAMSNDPEDPDFKKALENAIAAQTDAQQVDLVTLFQQEYEALVPNEEDSKLNILFATPNNGEFVNSNSNNDQVIAYVRQEADDAYRRVYEIIRSRVDEFGVAQPNIIMQPATKRIILELPGIKDPERARQLIVATAKLEFWETYDNLEVVPYLEQANGVLSEILGLADTTDVDTTLLGATPDSLTEDEPVEELTAIDDSTSIEDSTTEEDLLSDLLDGTEGDSAATDESQLTDEESARLYPLWNVMIPSVVEQNGQQNYASGPVVGYVSKSKRDIVDQYLSYPQVQALFPKNLKFLWGKDSGESGYYMLYAIKKSNANEETAPLEGDVIVDASQTYDQSGRPSINMSMNTIGAKTWCKITKENAVDKRSVAIVLDDIVYSAPRIQTEICGGNSEITGDFTVKEAQVLASIIKSGKLPAPAEIIEEEVVGATLGDESVMAGLFSLVLGIVLVLLFMILYYSASGVVANVVLLINLFIIVAALASFGASLTLPGMAGIVLTIGMAVDANVIIFERIREELAKGKGMRLAIEDGYKNSYSAVIDANLTTLITGFILMFFGLGPVKGFATVLVIGIISSFITAVLISRLIFDSLLSGDRKISFDTALTRNAFKNMNIQFISKRKTAYVVSAVIIVLGIGSMALRGFDFGVDFQGGRYYVVRFDQPVNTVDIGQSLADPFGGAPEVKTYGGDDQVKITTNYMIDETGTEVDSILHLKLYEGLKGQYSTEPSYDVFMEDYRMKSSMVNPIISDDIQKTSIFAALFAFIGIFLYILIRFRRWQFGLGALAAVVHDSLVLLGVFALLHGVLPFSMEIDQAFIAALLTIIGYSINDTVVVFDRVREYMTLHQTKDLKTLTNMAINSTLSRTLMTSVTTLIVVLALFLLGGPVIRGFSFALLIGVMVGTYSSIFVATPIVVDLLKTHKTKK